MVIIREGGVDWRCVIYLLYFAALLLAHIVPGQCPFAARRRGGTGPPIARVASNAEQMIRRASKCSLKNGFR